MTEPGPPTGAGSPPSPRSPTESGGRPGAGPLLRIVAGAVCAGLAGLIASAYWSLPDVASRVAPLVEESLAATGVASRVTAVLLAFRGYDTLLEVTVLLVAASAVHAVSAGENPGPVFTRGPAVDALLRLIAPLGVLLATYIVWRGSRAAGGAFQAGATLGGAVIALALGGVAVLSHVRPAVLRRLLVFGPAVFLGVGVVGLVTGAPFLEVPSDIGGIVIAAIEVALTLSIGLALVYLLGETLPGGLARPPRPGASSDDSGEVVR
ncbi:MAG: MnhB domain-containing protein [Gemmatimonadota bacterium]|nr:MnhB domain-containing protein [Gemmatimonadota bacterium]